MKITVTQAHIDAGFVGDCHACPIAIAIAEAGRTRGILDVSVNMGSVLIWVDDFHTECDLPPAAIRFVERYDQCVPVTPFSFELEDGLL